MSTWMLTLSVTIALLGSKASFITPINPPCINRCPFKKCGVGARCVFDPITCKSVCKCNTACPKVYRPVCGSDGVTYGNQCVLGIATCKSDGKIVKVSDGECPKCNRVCPKIYKLVCGSDGVTYENQCVLDITTCKSHGRIIKVSDGECPKCNDNCLDIYRPVCGSDGRTYSNQCELDFATCKSNGKIKKVSDGECKSLPLCPPPLPTDLFCGQALTIFCTEDCRQCCIAANTCQPGGIIPYTKTKDQCR